MRVQRQRGFEHDFHPSVEPVTEDLVEHPIAKKRLSRALRTKSGKVKRLVY